MKIEKVDALQMDWGGGKSAWVRVWADGKYGLGEASPMERGTPALEIMANVLSRDLVGADPLDTRVLYDTMFHRHVKIGPDGAFAAALAAVDIALWDLKGKLLGQPIYKLLGGAWKTSMPFYASVGGNAQRTVDEVCRAIEAWLPFKPAAIKVRFDGDRTTRDYDLPGDIAKARAVRHLVGDAFPLAFDANNNYSVQGAVRVGRVLEELGYTWFEEPVQHYHVEAMGKVANILDIAVSAGEQEYTLQGCKRLLDAGVDIIQPDIVKMGGFTGLSDVAGMARAYGADVLPHQTQPCVGQYATLHFLAALPHRHFPAEFDDRSGRQNSVFESDPSPKNGSFTLSDQPGLGLTIVEDELTKRSTVWHGGGA